MEKELTVRIRCDALERFVELQVQKETQGTRETQRIPDVPNIQRVRSLWEQLSFSERAQVRSLLSLLSFSDTKPKVREALLALLTVDPSQREQCIRCNTEDQPCAPETPTLVSSSSPGDVQRKLLETFLPPVIDAMSVFVESWMRDLNTKNK